MVVAVPGMGVCWQRFSLAAVLTTSALTTNAPGLKLLLVGNTSVGQAHNFLDRRLCLQTIEDVLPPSVLHQVDALRTFSDQGSLSRNRDKSIDSPHQI
ncbi:hypothetical protein SynA1560_00674 [Synechococcus sp. A15-60]|nr:hypothetical protein SynA1560_00674 [Synechococcus sp. A15-60]